MRHVQYKTYGIRPSLTTEYSVVVSRIGIGTLLVWKGALTLLTFNFRKSVVHVQRFNVFLLVFTFLPVENDFDMTTTINYSKPQQL